MRKGTRSNMMRGRVNQSMVVMTLCLGIRARWVYIEYRRNEVDEKENIERMRMMRTSVSILYCSPPVRTS
jgi:hypothetical protein